MFTLIHFAFQLFKIAIQATVYSLIILGIILLLHSITKNSRFRLIKLKTIYISIYVLMFIYSFTYWGNHGLGDETYIPLGHQKTMEGTDGYACFYLKPNELVAVDSFLVRNDHLYFASENSYYDYDLVSNNWDKYDGKSDYERYLSIRHLPQVNEFKRLYQLYSDYWNGWRFWFLP